MVPETQCHYIVTSLSLCITYTYCIMYNDKMNQSRDICPRKFVSGSFRDVSSPHHSMQFRIRHASPQITVSTFLAFGSWPLSTHLSFSFWPCTLEWDRGRPDTWAPSPGSPGAFRAPPAADPRSPRSPSRACDRRSRWKSRASFTKVKFLNEKQSNPKLSFYYWSVICSKLCWFAFKM